MSRSKRKPFWKDRTRNNHWWKRKANKIVKKFNKIKKKKEKEDEAIKDL